MGVNEGRLLLEQGILDEAKREFDEALLLNANDASAHDGLGLVASEHALYQDAEAAFRRACELSPGDAEYHFDLGLALQRLNKYQPAIESYAKAVALNPNLGKAYTNWGDILCEQNNFTQGLERYLTALKIDPMEFPYDAWIKALEHFEEEGREQANTRAEAAIERKAENATAYNSWGDALAGRRHYSEAAEIFKKAADLDPENVDAHNGWGDALFAQKKYAEAIAKYLRALQLGSTWISYDNWMDAVEKLENDERIKAEDSAERALGSKRENAFVYNSWGDALFGKKKYSQAIAKFKKATELAPDSVDAYNGWANALFKQEKYPEAVEKYLLAIKIDPGSGSYNSWVVTLEKLHQDEQRRAEERVEQAIEPKPENALVYTAWGAALSTQQKHPEAIEKFKKATELAPDSVDAYNGWGYTLRLQGKFYRAIEKYKKAVDLDPENVVAYVGWGDALFAQKKYADAVEKYLTALQLGSISNSYDNWVDAVDRLENDERVKAEESAERALGGKHENAFAYNDWGDALFGQKKYAAAIEKYLTALQLGVTWISYDNWVDAVEKVQKDERFKAEDSAERALGSKRENALAYNNWGNALLRQKKYPEAIMKFKKATELDSNDVSALNSWGDTLSSQKNYPAAIEKYKRATELDPSNVNAYNGWGNAFLDQKEYSAAIEKYKEAIDIDPRYSWSYVNWGLALVNEKNYVEATEKYDMATEIDPENVFAYYVYGNALLEQRRYDEAMVKYNAAVSTDNTYAYALHNMAYILDRQGKYQESSGMWKRAAEAYETAKQERKLFSDATDFQYFGNLLHGELREYSKAEAIYNEGLKLDPNHVGILIALGDLYKDWEADGGE